MVIRVSELQPLLNYPSVFSMIVVYFQEAQGFLELFQGYQSYDRY